MALGPGYVTKRSNMNHYITVKNHKINDVMRNVGPFGPRTEKIELDLGKTTNNTTELAAIYGALRLIELADVKVYKITIYGDSQYAGNLIFGNWTAKENKELVRKTKTLKQELSVDNDISWEYVKAHANDDHNNYADYLARSAAYNVPLEEMLRFTDWNKKQVAV